MAAPALAANVTSIDAGAPVAAAGFLGPVPALALDDGHVLLAAAHGPLRIAAHPGACVLAACVARTKFITGGDDGRVVAVSADGAIHEIADEKGIWIDTLAARDDGAIAWSCGKNVRARDSAGNVKTRAAPSSVRGLAFMPKGYRIAYSHYGGVSLWFPNTAAPPERFEWKGSHLGLAPSPDGRFVVTAMQENVLHGWRVADKTDMAMRGYPAKIRSLSWSADSHWLATSGADAAVVWPFKDRDLAGNKAPLECGSHHARVTVVAFHPKTLVLAAGYENGAVALYRIEDGAEITVRAAQKPEAAITALTWDQAGGKLLFGGADGTPGLVD